MRKPLGILTKNVAIYGAGDVAVTIVNFLLLPIYLRHLSQEDYGALALLIGVEALAKILFRFGLDGAFMRFYPERDDTAGQARLASTICLFLLGAAGVLAGTGLAGSVAIARHLFPEMPHQYVTALRLVLINTFLLTFTFVPFHVMRMRGEAATYAGVMLGRSVATLVLRLLLVVGLSWGVTGLMAADLIVTVFLLPLVWPWMRPLLRRAFSGADLRASLSFGLPRLPHGLVQQAFDVGNKYLLNQFVPLAQLGVYQIATTLGQSLKFFLSAFETGWAPFYYETARQPDAVVTFRKITTYGVAVLTLLVAGLSAITGDLVRLLTPESYAGASTVVPLIALGIAWQGVYLLTSIGLNLANQTKYYPVSTIVAAAVGLGGGWYLMPRYGATGAAVAYLLSYVTLALVAGAFARRYYPMRYETGRLARVVVAGVLATAAGLALPDMHPLAGVLARGLLTTVVFAGLLWLGGFLRPTERGWLQQALYRGWNRRRLSGTES